jgi:hypothetical protein
MYHSQLEAHAARDRARTPDHAGLLRASEARHLASARRRRVGAAILTPVRLLLARRDRSRRPVAPAPCPETMSD